MGHKTEWRTVTSDWRLSVSARCLSALAFLSSASLARFASISALRLSDMDGVSRPWKTSITTSIGLQGE